MNSNNDMVTFDTRILVTMLYLTTSSKTKYIEFSITYLILLCVAIWVLRFDGCPKALSQTVHWYGVAEL